MIKPFRFCLYFLLISCTSVFAWPADSGPGISPGASVVPAGNNSSLRFDNDSIPLPVRPKDTLLVVVPFEYKQSALVQPRTLEAIDSVILILLKNKKVTLEINGFAHLDEGSNKICQYLSEDRAGFIRDYVLARGVDSSRILSTTGYGNTRPFYKGTNKYGVLLNCRAEVKLNYPQPPKKVVIPDTDEDGLADNIDKCPGEFGEAANNGCPYNNILVVFEKQQSFLASAAYPVMDSVVTLLKNNPSYTIAIEGHAYKGESEQAGCNILARERADIVKNYLMSRFIPETKILWVKSFSNTRPLNAGKTPQEIAMNSRVEIILNR